MCTRSREKRRGVCSLYLSWRGACDVAIQRIRWRRLCRCRMQRQSGWSRFARNDEEQLDSCAAKQEETP
jgi:hypothetical protein